jgi:GAF domain-containing protein
LSRKGAKSRTQGRKLRSTGTKSRARVGQVRTPYADLEQQLESYRRELADAREQQAAIADVLKVISRSTFDLQSVLETLCASAARLCNTEMVGITRSIGGKHFQVANFGYSPDFSAHTKRLPLSTGRGSLTGRVLLEKDTVHICDVLDEPEYAQSEAQKIGGFRTMLGVPLMREANPIGVIILLRRTVRPFTDRQIELVKTFADKAVIAIENVRLFEAEQQRTRQLSEALEQQTATADVLQAISTSPGELGPVFGSILANATRLCEAKFATLWLCERGGFRSVALHNAPPAFAHQQAREPVIHPGFATALGRVATTKQVAQIADVKADRAYREGDPVAVASVELAGMRTLISVPMLKEGELIGAISIYRQRCGRLPTSRSSWSRTSPPRPSSRSKTPVCSTSCVSRCSSRPPPPTCSR